MKAPYTVYGTSRNGTNFVQAITLTKGGLEHLVAGYYRNRRAVRIERDGVEVGWVGKDTDGNWTWSCEA